MRKKLITTLTAACSFMAVVATTALADYSNSVVSLNPVAYWPLNETVQPPAPYLATNIGTVGAAGNGYYETWYAPTNNGFNAAMAWTGPGVGVTGDGNTSANFGGNDNQYIQIPHTFSSTVIKAPFSVECWTCATNTSDWVSLVGNGGQYQHANNASGSYAGFYLDHYGGSWLFGLYNTNGTGHSVELNGGSVAVNQWTHLVGTYDGTNANLYVNGTLVATAVAATNSLGLGYVPDMVNPIIIGTLGRKYSNAYNGLIDEVAIYTNVLTPDVVNAHYSTVSGPTYASMILTSSPSIYLRLGEPAYTLPPSNTFSSFPLAHSYGSIGDAAVGLYQPGTLPGVSGPTGSGFGAANYAVAINGQNAGVDVGNGNLTNVAPQLNVTGTNTMSVIAWYKANPADVYDRFQNILGHSDSGWRVGFGGTGPRFNPGGGGEIDSSDLYNDGRWHMLSGVHDSVSNYLYLDGVLVKSTAYTGSQTGSARDVILGGDPQYTTPAGRFFEGRIAQVSFFTNAISASNILMLYSNAQMYPFIISQPTSANVNAGIVYTNKVITGGSPTLNYQWYQNNLAVSGQTNLNLVLNPVAGADAGNYYLIVTNNGGAVTSSVVTLTVNTSPQITSVSGTNYILFAGGSAALSVSAIGANPVYYYWYSNSVVVAASTSATNYMVTNASQTTVYTVMASNYLGSASGIVTVDVVPKPTNTYPQTVLADNPIAYWRMDETDTGYPNTGVTTYDYWGGHNGAYLNTELSQAGYSATPADPDTAALFGDIVDSDSYAGQIPGIDFAATNGGNAELSVEAWVNIPTGQLHDGGVITKGTGAGGEQFNLDTGAGSHALRFFVRDAGGGVHLANSSVIPDGQWHHVVGVCDEANGNIYLYIDGALAASTTISAGSGLLSSANPVSIGSRQGGASGAYDQQLYGTVDEVAVYNYPLTPAQVTAHYYSIGGFAPVITKQPTNITVNAGSTVTFNATAGGSPTLAYQWYDVTAGFPGAPIFGATNSTLTLVNVTSAQNGNLYALVVTNNINQVTSSSAQLTVISGPPTLQADINPLYVKAFVGTPLTFSVTVGGTPPFHYQWNQDGSPVGLNTNTYALLVIPGTNTYNCFITNSAGSISSSTATIVGVAITDTGTNTDTSSTTFAINFMDAANAAYTLDGGSTWTNVTYQGLGVYPDAPNNTNWNGFGQFPNGYLPEFNSAVIPQVASDGTLTPVTLSLVYGFDSGALAYGSYIDGYPLNTAQGEPSLILGECAVVNGGNPVGNITISNVPPGTYALYLYAANVNNDRGATFNFTSGSPLGGTNAVINSNPGSGPASNFVYGVTYVIYTGVAPDANGTITGTWGAVDNPNSGNTGEGDFNGLQLVRVSGPTATPPILTIQLSGVNTIISWSPTNGVLQSATSLTGTFTDIGGATSPYTNSVSGDQQFFRVKVP